jgi:molybdopterin-guanine dinucleotide biosynthesis protein A
MNYPTESTKVAGWVLAGGQSRRMGRDKARLAVEGVTLLERIRIVMQQVSFPVEVIAPKEAYVDLGIVTLPDSRPHCGPLGGIETALERTTAEWNLVVACDMPYLTAGWLGGLIKKAQEMDAEVVCGWSPEKGASPLCAVWRRGALPKVQAALDAGQRRVKDLLEILTVEYVSAEDSRVLANWNTPEDVAE